MVVRLVGTNAEEGRKLLADAKMITADTLVDAAQKAVAAVGKTASNRMPVKQESIVPVGAPPAKNRQKNQSIR